MLKMKMTRNFFDQAHVKRAIEKGKIKGLRTSGGYIRKAAQRGIAKREGASSPGHAPYSHEGSLRGNIFFAYDTKSQSVVVGPAKLNVHYDRGDGRPAKGVVPEVLEFGGVIGFVEAYIGPPSGSMNAPWNWERVTYRTARSGRFRARNPKTRHRKVFIAARPYMGPATKRSLPYIPTAFKNTIKGP